MDLFGVRLVVGKEGRQDYSQLSVLSSRWILLNGENQERNSLEFKKKNQEFSFARVKFEVL